jgi:hypothetical protein
MTEVAERQLALAIDMGLGGKDLAAVFLSLVRHHESVQHQ